MISLRRDPVVRATALMAFVLGLPLAVPAIAPELRSTYSETCITVPFLLLAIGTFRWRLAGAPDGERRFWTWMTAAVACWLTQQAIVIGTYPLPRSVSLALVEDLLYVGLYLFMVLALDVRPHLELEHGDRGVLASLRRAGTVVFLFGVLVYLVFVPAELDPDSYWAGTPSFILYVVLDLYLVLRLSDALADSVERRWRLVYGWLLVTCSAWLVLDTIEALMWAEVLPWVGPGTPWDLPWMVPLVSLVMAGRVRALAGVAEEAPPLEAAPRRRGAPALGSPLILITILAPLLHFSVYGFELFGQSTRRAHELVAFGLLVVLGGLVVAYQRTLETRNRRLELERREALARVEHQAYHDPLTGLPNRRLLDDRFTQAMAQADRRGERLALLFFDLDGFKAINDTNGHAVGDELLRRIGQRLRSRVRSSDTLARVGGDEFVVMATNVETRATAVDLAEKVRRSLGEPFEVDDAAHRVSASVGVSLYPDDGRDLNILLRAADSAMYAAKGGGLPRRPVSRPLS